MNHRLQQIFDETPQDGSRSKLDPYRQLIFRWRRQGRTYRRIRELLAEKCGVETNVANLYRYAQRRARPCETEPEMASAAPAVVDASTPRRSPEEIAAERVRITAFRSQPSLEPSHEIVFVFDESKPITKTPQKG